jgi:hypothetical protein
MNKPRKKYRNRSVRTAQRIYDQLIQREARPRAVARSQSKLNRRIEVYEARRK